MIQYANEENYQSLVSEGVVLVDFYGENCQPCKMLARVLEELDDELPFINIVKVNTDECPNLSKEFKIYGIPDVYFYKDGKVISHGSGLVDIDEIKEKLSQLLY